MWRGGGVCDQQARLMVNLLHLISSGLLAPRLTQEREWGVGEGQIQTGVETTSTMF